MIMMMVVTVFDLKIEDATNMTSIKTLTIAAREIKKPN